jgi:predicted enzyme related to lactoylglutathione lyase
VFADPTGAVFGVWESGQHKGAGLVNEPGALCWNECYTRDVDAAKKFYGAVFGWDAQPSGIEGMDYTIWNLGEDGIGGLMDMTGRLPDEVPPNWLATFAVEDADATVAKLKELGGSVNMEPMTLAIGRFAVVSDPHGAPFGVIALAEPSS